MKEKAIRSTTLIKIIIWLLCGLITGMALAAIILSGDLSLMRLYNVGDVYEIESTILEVEGDGFEYKESRDNFFTITKSHAVKKYRIQENELPYWNIVVDNMNKENVECELEGFLVNDDDEWVSTNKILIRLFEGDNIIKWDSGKVSRVALTINDEEGTTIRIKNFLFMNKKLDFTWLEFVSISLIGFSVFLIFTAIIYKMISPWREKHRNLFDTIIDYYQIFLCNILNLLPKWGAKLSSRNKTIIRTLCFVFWIFYFIFIINIGRRESFGKLHYLFSAVIMIIIGITSIEGKLEKLNWSNKLVKLWIVFWSITCISDFFITKHWGFVGYFFLIVGSIAFIIWGNMQNPYEILKSIIYSFHISFIIVTLFCFVSRPIYEESSYVGINCNPNIFGFYLVMIAAACVAHIQQLWKHGGKKIFYVLLCIEADFLLYFMLKSECRGGILAFGFLAFVLFFQMFRKRKEIQSRKRMLAILFSVLLLLGPIWIVSNITLTYLPHKLNTVVLFHEDSMYRRPEKNLYIGRIPGSIVEASDNKLQRRLGVKSIDNLSSGRIKIWKSYLRQMNLIGNYDKAKINGAKRYAHNSFIAIGFLYGVYSVIPYGIMWIIIFKRSYKGNGQPYELFVFALCSSYFILALFDALEQPWRDPIWILTYYVIGYLFADGKTTSFITNEVDN